MKIFFRARSRTRGFNCKRYVELSNWCCNSSSEQFLGFYKKSSNILRWFLLQRSSLTVTRLSLMELSSPAVLQCIYALTSYLRAKLLWTSVPSSYWHGWESLFRRDRRSGRYPHNVRPLEMLSRCNSLYLTGAPCGEPVLCSYWNSPCTEPCRWSMTFHSDRFDLWLSSVLCARFLLDDGQLRFRVLWEDGRLLLRCWRYMRLLAICSVFWTNELG